MMMILILQSFGCRRFGAASSVVHPAFNVLPNELNCGQRHPIKHVEAVVVKRLH